MNLGEKEPECIVCRDNNKLTRNWFICHTCECLVCNYCLDHLKNDLCPKCRQSREGILTMTNIMAYSHIAIQNAGTNYSKIIYYKLAYMTKDRYIYNINAQKQFIMLCEKAEAYYFLAKYFFSKKQKPKGIEYLKKSVEAKEDLHFDEAAIALGNIYWSQSKNQEAIELFLEIDIAVNSTKVSNEILFMVAKTCFQRKDYSKAFKIFNKLDYLIKNGEENSHLIYQYLGHFYNHGLGVDKDIHLAFIYYTKCLGDRKKDNKIKKKMMEMIDEIRKLK